MTREILPVFEELEERQIAEALSEPFLVPGKYSAEVDKGLAVDNLEEPAAVGAAYITEDGEVDFAFSLSLAADKPYTCTQSFFEGYERIVSPFHRERKRIEEGLGFVGISGNEFNANQVVEKAKAADLRTLAGFAIFMTGSSKLAGALFVARKAASEIPLDGRDHMFNLQDNVEKKDEFDAIRSQIIRASGSAEFADRRQEGIKQHDNTNQRFGTFVCTLHLPEAREVKKLMSADPQIGNYLDLPRKERRKLLKQERKQK